jgi:membrane-associated phospholipid phosphatase
MNMGSSGRVCALILAFLVVPGGSAAAQEAPSRASEESLTLGQAGRDFLYDAGRIWSSPFRLKARDVAPLIALAAGTAFLIAADEDIRDGVQSFAKKHSWVGDVGPVVTQMGSIGAWATAGAFFGAGLIFKDEKARDTGYLAASAMAQTFLVENVMKSLSGRQRPYVADGVDHWSGPGAFFKRFDKDYQGRYVSFPSGHTATAFTLATIIALQYRHRDWVPIVAYSIAAGVGLSRMAMDRHWASDVLVGAVVGHLIARLVLHNHGRRQRLVPALACSGRAISFSIQYDLSPVDR